MKNEDGSCIVNDRTMQIGIMFSIAFVSFMSSVDTYIVNISLPTIARYFNVGTGDVSWIVLAYLLAVTSTLMIFGKLGDKIGLKKVFLWGFGTFTLFSVLCGISTNIMMLIISRFFQGVGGSMLLGMGPAMIPKFLPASKRGTAFGYYATSAALGIALGTPLGGIITGYFSWHWIFLINLPIGIIAMWYSNKTIPDDKGEKSGEEGQKFDFSGAVLVFLSLSLLVFGLNMGKEISWTSIPIMSALGVGLILWTVFIHVEKKAESPLLDLALFKDSEFTYGNLASCFAASFFAANNFLMPFYLEGLKELKTQQAGFVILVYSGVYMAGTLYFGKAGNKIKPRILCTWGMVLGAVVSIAFALNLGRSGLAPVIAFLIGHAVAFSMFIPSNNNVIMGMAPQGKHGIVSGVFRMGVYISLIAGVVVFETVFNYFLPQANGASVNLEKVATPVLAGAFRNAYLLGGVFCVLSVVFSMLAKEKDAEPTSH